MAYQMHVIREKD